MVLAGDVGATNARLALFEVKDGSLEMRDMEIYPCREYAGLGPVLRAFLEKRRPPDLVSACIGIAGIIRKGRVDMINLDWKIDIAELAREMELDSLVFINDLEANGHGLGELAPRDFEVLHAGEEDDQGSRCLVSAGTGLGEGGMIMTPEGYLPIHTEGGHVAFGPRNEEEIALLRHLLPRLGYVSYENIVSGPGLSNLYGFFRDTGRAVEPAWLADRMREGDPGRIITESALAGTSELCVKTLDMFVSIYGAAAGNMALKLMATGGVFLGGGIAPRILPKLKGSAFLEAFSERGGKLKAILDRIPVKVVLNDKAALLGAARVAAREDRFQAAGRPA